MRWADREFIGEQRRNYRWVWETLRESLRERRRGGLQENFGEQRGELTRVWERLQENVGGDLGGHIEGHGSVVENVPQFLSYHLIYKCLM